MHIHKKRVSIVIPTFNRAHYLTKTIDSCLNQTYPCEILVCDHGSKDQTKHIMEKYIDKVIYIRREKDFGPHYCWLDGVLHASNDYIHLQYDDDWLQPTFIEECMNLFEPEVGFVYTEAMLFDDKNNEMICNPLKKTKETRLISVKFAEPFVANNLISPGAAVFRKNDLIDSIYQGRLPNQVHTYHGVGPDRFISLLCLLRYKKIGYVAKPLAVFRVHDNSITIDAYQNKEKAKLLKKAYSEVVDYYYLLKWQKVVQNLKYLRLSFWVQVFSYMGKALIKINKCGRFGNKNVKKDTIGT